MVRILCLLFCVVLTGCAQMSDVLQAKEEGEGISRIYEVTPDEAWQISRAVFRWEGGETIEEHRDEGYMLTSSGMNPISWGTHMGAWIEPVDAKRTQVTVITKRKVATGAVTTLTETGFHKRFRQGMEIVKAGKPLPLEAPGD